jgi:hypothetical protein
MGVVAVEATQGKKAVHTPQPYQLQHVARELIRKYSP